jgi:DNA-binding XRE family transcriptional regulator
MSNLASALKSEVTRIARKEIRSQTEGLRKSLTATRSELKDVKQRLRVAEQALAARDNPARPAQPQDAAAEPPTRSPRFSRAWLLALRKRQGLTQTQLAQVIGVSALSVYNWESGRVRPRDSFIHAIAAVRSLSQDELAAKLAPPAPGST